MRGYPVLKEDIFFAKIVTPTGIHTRVRNTTTRKDINVNNATSALLELCTGANSVSDIINKLSEQFDEPVADITEGAHSILKFLKKKNTITIHDNPSKTEEKVKKITVNHPIEYAEIEITNKCNLSCLHCINDSGDSYPEELTTDEILSVIDQLSALGVYSLTISGGEPVLHPDFFTIVKHARKAPMTVLVQTNSTVLTKDFVKKIKQLRIALAISLDSVNNDIFDTFRGKKGALKKVLTHINILKEAGIPVSFTVSVSQLNKDAIIPILHYFKKHGITDFKVGPVIFSGRGIPNLTISTEEYYHVMVNVFTYLKEKFPEGLHDYGQEETCGVASSVIGIKADGTVLPCSGCHKDMGVGNVKDTDLAVLWDENETLEMIRNITVEKDPQCRECAYKRFCNGCIADSFLFKRIVRCYDQYSCALYKAYDQVVGLAKR